MQNERGIKAHKNVHLTSEGLELYLRDSLIEFLSLQASAAAAGVNKFNNPKDIAKK